MMRTTTVSSGFIICVLFILMCRLALAQQTSVIPVDPRVKIGKLANGLTYYIHKNAEPKNRSELYLVVKAGSNMEDDDQLGLAHFVEHMAFNGTKDFPKNQLVDYLQKAGIRFGADLNAYTSFDETVYQLPLPTDDPELFSKGFTILANWAGHVSFDGDEIEKERGIIVEEDRARGKDAGERMRKEILPVIFQASRYADRLPIGKMEVVSSFKHDVIKRYYKDWYRPELQAIIAVGDFDAKAVEKLIEKNFSKLKNPKKARPHERYTIPLNKTSMAKVVTDPEFSYTVGYIFLKHPKLKQGTTEDLKTSAKVNMINQMFAARIQEIMESGNAPFIHAEGYYGPYYGGLGNINSFLITTVAKDPATMKEAVEGIMTEVGRVNKYGFTASELERAKQNFLADLDKQYNERDKTSSAHYVNQYVSHFLRDEPIPGISFLHEFYKSALKNISLDEINSLAQSVTENRNCTAILEGLESTRDQLPDEATFLSWIQNAGKEVAPYEDETIDEPLLATTPVKGKIISENKVESLGVTELKLSNGITVVLKPTDFKQDEIIFSASSRGGTSLSPEESYLSASIAADVVSSSGIAQYDKSQLSRLLSGKLVSVSPYIDQLYEGVWGSAAPKDMETAFQLMYLYLTQPRSDSNIFKMIKDNYRVNVAARPAFPNAVYQDTISAVMGGYHKRSMMPSVKEVETLDVSTAYQFYKDRFSDVSDFTFFFVGNFSVDSLKLYLETYLGSIPSVKRSENYRNLNIKPVHGKLEKQVYKGLEDKAAVSLFLHDEYEYNDENNLMLQVLNSVLKIKLIERLREKESGVYTPSVQLSYSNIPFSSYTYSISFSCASGNVEKLIEATMEEISALRKEGVSSVDLEKFKAEEKRQVEVRLRDNHFWLDYLSNVYTKNEPRDKVLKYPSQLEAIRLEDTKAAAQRFLTDKNLKKIVLLPEAALGSPLKN